MPRKVTWPGDLISLERPRLLRWRDNGVNKSRRDRVLKWSYSNNIKAKQLIIRSAYLLCYGNCPQGIVLLFSLVLLSSAEWHPDPQTRKLNIFQIFQVFRTLSPWAEEYWPSSADSCRDHQSSRPCASAPGPHWTSCPWWLSSPCPRCCLSRQKNLPPEESCVQEPRRKPVILDQSYI